MREKIVVRSLRKVYTIDEGFGRRSQITAFEGLSLAVAEGELVTIIGPSGCGKSTFLRTPWRARGSSSSGGA